eukprot:11200149-Lingulodinium_polyedra.AAC.1
MDSWEWCLRHHFATREAPVCFQRPAQELQAFAEDAQVSPQQPARRAAHLGSNPRASEPESLSCVSGCTAYV